MPQRRRSTLRERVLGRVPAALRKLRNTCSSSIREIEAIRRAVDRLPIEPFREPKSVIDIRSGGVHTLMNMNADTLTCWAQHIAYSTRFRMRSLEQAALLQAAELQMLAAMTLVRAHLEAAGLAALAFRTILRCVKTGDPARLRELVPQTMFGSGTAMHAETNDTALMMCGITEGNPYRVGHGIDALDLLPMELSGLKTNRALFKLHYAVLCEFAHPTMRTSKRFVRRADADPPEGLAENGWTIEYGPDEDAMEELPMALGMLANSMHSGHAYSELVRCCKFVEESSELYLVPPDEAEFKRVYRSLLASR